MISISSMMMIHHLRADCLVFEFSFINSFIFWEVFGLVFDLGLVFSLRNVFGFIGCFVNSFIFNFCFINWFGFNFCNVFRNKFSFFYYFSFINWFKFCLVFCDVFWNGLVFSFRDVMGFMNCFVFRDEFGFIYSFVDWNMFNFGFIQRFVYWNLKYKIQAVNIGLQENCMRIYIYIKAIDIIVSPDTVLYKIKLSLYLI